MIMHLGLLFGSVQLQAQETEPTFESTLDPQKIAAERLPQIQNEIARLSTTYLDPMIRENQNRFIVRLNEGRLKYIEQDYRAATEILLDIVETYKGNRKSPMYEDALFYLSDALFHIGHIRSAQRFFNEILHNHRAQFHPCSLGRLIEISLILNQPEKAQKYQTQALNLITQVEDPHLIYLLGKYSYRLQQHQKADTLFAKVNRSSSVYPQALYYRAINQFRLGEYETGIRFLQLVINLDLKQLKINRAEEEKIEKLNTIVQCTFRSQQEQIADERGWNLVIEQSRLSLARIYYELDQLDRSLEAYLKIDRNASTFKEAIKESVWVAIKQKDFKQALQRLEIQLIEQPNILDDPPTRILKARLLSIQGRFNDARSLFKELRERFDFLKSRTLAPILRKAKGQLSSYFQKILEGGQTALNLEALIPKDALAFTSGELSNRVARSLFVEIDALDQDIKGANQDIKRLYWVLESPNQSEMFPQIHKGLLKSIGLQSQLVAAQEYLNRQGLKSQKGASHASTQHRSKLAKIFYTIPQSEAQIVEREFQVEQRLIQQDLKTYRFQLIIQSLRSQLVALEYYINDHRVDQFKDVNPQKKRSTQRQVKQELILNEDLHKKATALSETINRLQLKVGLHDQAYQIENQHRIQYKQALEQESNWLASRNAFPLSSLSKLQSQHELIEDFQTRSKRLIQKHSLDLLKQVQTEETKIKTYTKRLNRLNRQANRLGGRLVADTFYQVLKTINSYVLEIDAGLLDVFWSQKSKQSSRLQDQRDLRRSHLEIFNRDLVDVPR
jgi:hypothetical protein